MPPLRLVKLTDADVTLSLGPPGLTQTAADTLGDDMTAADGFDVILQSLAVTVSAEIPWVAWWTSGAQGADFTPGGIVGSLIGPLISDFATFTASGDNQSADMDWWLGGSSSTVPPPPTVSAPKTPVRTAPVSGPATPGGGGQGGGGDQVYVDISTGEVYLSPDAGGGGEGFVGKWIK